MQSYQPCVSDAVDDFRLFEGMLKHFHPQAIAEAEHLAASVVDCEEADAETVWNVLWNKPLFANARVAVSLGWLDKLAPEMVGAWRVWGADPEVFRITKTGPGVRRDAFTVRGSIAIDLVDRHRIPLHRLHRIQGAAAMLRKRAQSSSRPFRGFSREPLSTLVPSLQRELGVGWGPVTVLHLLTDFGLAVKPDIHLVSTIADFDLWSGARSEGTLSVEDTIEINAVVDRLGAALFDPYGPRQRRYLDKVLMEISRLLHA